MKKIRYPRLLDKNLKEIARLIPVKLSLELSLAPPSTATLVVVDDRSMDIKAGDFIQLYTADGFAGIFRVAQCTQAYSGTISLALEHSIKTLSDHLIPVKTEEDFTTTAAEAFASALSYQSRWTLGVVEVPDDIPLTYGYDYTNVFEAVTSLMAELPEYMLTYTQEGVNWILNVVKKQDSAASEFRLAHNVENIKITIDRTELCTRVYVPGVEAPIDADTIDEWGLVERSISADSEIEQSELIKEAQRYLDLHKTPKVMLTVSAIELNKLTGEAMDSFQLGWMCRGCLPGKKPIQQYIVKKVYSDVYSKPLSVQLTLANEVDSTASVIAGLIVDTTVVKKRVSYNADNIAKNKELILEAEELISLRAKEIELLSKQLTIESERIDINAKNILTNADTIETHAKTLATHAELIQTNADRIETNAKEIVTNAERIETNAYRIETNAKDILTQADRIDTQAQQITTHAGLIQTNADQISTQANLIQTNADRIETNAKSIQTQAERIDVQAGTLTLKADRAELDAYVKITTLEADYAKFTDLDNLRANISNLTSGLTTATVIKSNLINCNQGHFTFLNVDSITHNGAAVSQRSITMGDISSTGKALSTGGVLDLQHSHKIVDNGDGTFTLGEAASTGGSFNIAATQTYKNGVAAAKESVTLAAPNGWQNGRYVVEASNGKTHPVSLPSFASSGGTAFDSTNKTTVYFSTPSVNTPLKSVVVDANDVYNKGWNECRAAAVSWRVLVNYYSVGETLYDSDGNVATGPWYKGTEAYRYALPAAK